MHAAFLPSRPSASPAPADVLSVSRRGAMAAGDDEGNLRARFKELDKKRANLELEIEVVSSRLETTKGQKLVDDEGFPRDDVDVFAIRNDRAKVAQLHGDHKQVTQEIEAVMAKIFAGAKE